MLVKIPVKEVIFGLSGYRPAVLLDISSFTGTYLNQPTVKKLS